jgi:hypothetical protein
VTLSLCGTLACGIGLAAPPEPLDTDFLDYLADCEGKDDNWTVVANDKERQKARAPRETKPPAEPPKQEDKP